MKDFRNGGKVKMLSDMLKMPFAFICLLKPFGVAPAISIFWSSMKFET